MSLAFTGSHIAHLTLSACTADLTPDAKRDVLTLHSVCRITISFCHPGLLRDEFTIVLSCRYGVGQIYFRQEKYEMAEYHFRRSLLINQRSSVLRCYVGSALHKIGRAQDALDQLQVGTSLHSAADLLLHHTMAGAFCSVAANLLCLCLLHSRILVYTYDTAALLGQCVCIGWCLYPCHCGPDYLVFGAPQLLLRPCLGGPVNSSSQFEHVLNPEP